MHLTSPVEMRQGVLGRTLHGVMLQEGRAARMRREVFAPGSVRWPSNGVSVLLRHHGEPHVRAMPERQADGRITIEAPATPSIRETVAGGRRHMSVEFHSLDEATTGGGIREIRSAFVPSVALVADPEYTQTVAEIRAAGGRLGGSFPLRKDIECKCRSGGTRRWGEVATVAEIETPADTLAYLSDVKRALGRVRARSRRRSVELSVDLDDSLPAVKELLALIAAGAPIRWRPFPDGDASDFETEGRLTRWRRLVVQGWILVPGALAGDAPKADVKEGRGVSARRRLLLAGLA